MFYFIYFVALPFAVLPVGRVLAGMLIFHVVLSLTLTFVFNLAHAIGKADFPKPSGNPATIEEEWAAHQMRTTVNFANGNRALNWFAGGLNFQIEHHLFPQISHTHYPDISTPSCGRGAWNSGCRTMSTGTPISAPSKATSASCGNWGWSLCRN